MTIGYLKKNRKIYLRTNTKNRMSKMRIKSGNLPEILIFFLTLYICQHDINKKFNVNKQDNKREK